VELENEEVAVKGFCTDARKLLTKRLNRAQVSAQDRTMRWKSASAIIRDTALARIWGHRHNSVAAGGWLEDGTVDTVMRWSLYGNTRVGGLAPNLTRSGYIPCSTLSDLRRYLDEWMQETDMSGSPLLQTALEGLTGLHGSHWREVKGDPPMHGVELKIPPLQQALAGESTLRVEDWREMNVSGLQLHHYVKTGNKIMMPKRYRSHKLVKWMKENGCRMDLQSMDQLFAAVHSGNHYFTIQWCKTTVGFTVRDSLSHHIKPEHKEAMVLLWAILLASARDDDNLWLKEPVLTLSEDQVLGEFQDLVLRRPGCKGWHLPLTEDERENLRRMGIQVQNSSERATSGWTWQRDARFPQQSNGNDCGMAAIVAVIHLARGWQLPSMDETTINRYRSWLSKVITDDSEDIFEVPCQRCGTTQLQTQTSTMKCANKSDCDFARANLHDSVTCVDLPGPPRGASGGKRSTTDAQLRPNGERQHPRSASTGADQCLLKQEVDRDVMAAEPLPSEVQEQVAGYTTEAQCNVEARGQRAVPVTEGKKPITTCTERLVISTLSPRTELVTERQSTSGEQRLKRHTDQRGRKLQRVQTQTRQRKLTEGFVTTTSQHQRELAWVPPARTPLKTLQSKKTEMRGATGCHTWVKSSLRERQSIADQTTSSRGVPDMCAGCSRQILESSTAVKCIRCRTMKYCNAACSALHWVRDHKLECTPCNDWCPACGEDAAAGSTTTSTCARCQKVTYCSPKCLHSDFNNHLYRCPLVAPDQPDSCEPRPMSAVDGSRVQIPALTQPGDIGPERRILVDNEDEIRKVRDARWRLGRGGLQVQEEEDIDASKCEAARDQVIEWCVNHNPRSEMEAWRAATRSAKIITELLKEVTGDRDFTCTSEMWQAAIRVRDELLIPAAQKLGEERGKRIWKICLEKELEVRLCFQGIQASNGHQAKTLLRETGIDATEEEWEKATCIIRRRRGARPPRVTVTMKVRPNACLQKLVLGLQMVGQHKPEVWVCRPEEHPGRVTTLIQEPETGGHCLRSWTKIYDMLGVPEHLQRELVVFSIMVKQPSFLPMDILIGTLENPCSLAEVWKAKGDGSGPIQIAGNQTLVTPGNVYATNEGCSIAGKESYNSRMRTGNHRCLHRGAQSCNPMMNIQVGLPEFTEAMKWCDEHSEISEECSTRVRHLVPMVPEWWLRCQVRMRWETREQGSERERDSLVCIRLAQVGTNSPVANREITAKGVEDELLILVNHIREQCFQHAENFAPGDVRYQGFENREGLGRGMVTIHRRKVTSFEVDVAIGCLLGFFLGNELQAGSGRAYKWCPFWGKLGTTSARITSITRASDYYNRARVAVRFGRQTRGRAGWIINNPKAIIVRRMLQLLQQRAGSGPLLASLKMPVWEPLPRLFRVGQQRAVEAEAQKPPALPTSEQVRTTPEEHASTVPVWWNSSHLPQTRLHDNEISRLLRWNQNDLGSSGRGVRKLLLTRKQEYILLGGDRAGCNAVLAEHANATPHSPTRRYWGVWAEAAKRVSEYWQAEKHAQVQEFLQELREHGHIGLANRGEDNHSSHQLAWWLQWLEWEALWTTKPNQSDVITWNIGPQRVDLSFPQIEKTLSKGAAVVMLQEVSFHPGERRRVKSTFKKLGPEYWCVMEASQRVRAGQEELKAGVSKANYKAPWVYAVVTFLHKDVFKRPIRVDWAGQYTRKTMKHMLLGRMSCLWAPRHSESPMLVVNIHQAGSATVDLQQHVWVALQAVRAKYPEAQGIIGGDFNANASGDREGYSRGNEAHMKKVDDQFQACVAEMKGTIISPRTPSWIDVYTGKGARLDHLVGLGVEFTCASGRADWVGSPFQDHARVSFAVKVGTLKPMANKAKDREWHQKLTMKQWQGISHQIDDPLRVLAQQSLDRLQQGKGDADLERRQMLATRIAAAKQAMPSEQRERQARMPFRNKQQQALLRTRSRMEAALRDANAKRGLSLVQLACMHDLGITGSLSLSEQDKELLIETPQWKALLRAEIQNSKNRLDHMARKQTRQCEHQAKQKEAREYLRDKKGPSKFCGNTLPLQAPKELVQSMPVGILRITQGPKTTTNELIETIRQAIPSVEIQSAEGEVAILTLTLPEERADEGAALLLTAQQQWRWRTAFQNPRRFMDIIRNLCTHRGQGNPTDLTLRHIAQDAANIVWEGQPGHKHAMTIGNTGSQHREERSWWAQGPTCLEQLQEWKQWIQHCQSKGYTHAPSCITITNGVLSLKSGGGQRMFTMDMDTGNFLEPRSDEIVPTQPRARDDIIYHEGASQVNKVQETWPFTKGNIWHDPSGTVMYVQVQRILDWETLALLTQVSKEQQRGSSPNEVTFKIIMSQGPWGDEEVTMAWERYLQTEGLSQHVCCQHCDSQEKPFVVVTPGKMDQRRQLVGFCTLCWKFTSKHHSKDTTMDMSFFKQFNPLTGRFHRALPYAENEHPRRIRGPVTDHELDQFRKERLKLRKAGGPDKSTNELFRSLTGEEMAVVREWADRALRDAQSAASTLTDEVLNCSIRLLHKGGETSDKPSDWRPIGLLNVGIQLLHHVINSRLTIITEAGNIIVPGQDGGRARRGVDLNQLKLDWITNEAQRLRQRIIRIDIDFKNAFNSMSQDALWAVMRAYNIPDVDLLEAIYSRTTASMDPEDARCATITFLTGVIQGGASSPRIFTIFINALLEHLTCTGQALGISHGIEETEQFNNVAFMDDVTVVTQDDAGAQTLLDATQEFETWSNMRLNLTKTVVVVTDGGSGERDPPQLTYHQRPVKVVKATDSCRHLGFWATPDGNMAATKQRVLVRTKEVLGLLTHHPLETKVARELFQSMAISVFRFSAAQVRWSQAELDQLQSVWTQAYKRAEYLSNGTANDVFVFPKQWGGGELSTPVNIIAQELCNNIRRCLVHDDVAKSITIQELQRAKDEWMCNTLDELYDEMELWRWNEVQHNRWTRALKACNQVKVRPLWHVDEQENDDKKLSWATATRLLRKLKARILQVGGKRDHPKEQEWQLEDAAQWELVFRGEEVFWKTAKALRKAGHESILSLIQEPSSTNRSVPLLTRDEELGRRGTVHLQMLVPKGIAGVTEDDRATLQAWLELVDWTGLGVAPKYPTPRGLKLNMDSTSTMHQWLTLQERQCGVHHHDAAQMFTNFRTELETLAKAIATQSDVGDRVEVISGGAVLGTALIKWLKDGEADIKVAREVTQAVWPRVCEGRSPVHSAWTTSCESKLELAAKIESWMRVNNTRCERHLIKLGYFCPGCQHGLCTVCNDIESRKQCPVCQTLFPLMPSEDQHTRQRQLPGARCLNLHNLGEQWIEEVTGVDFVPTSMEDCPEGEHLRFKAHVRGWKTEARERRCQRLLGMTAEHQLRKALLEVQWKDIMLVPQAWYPAHTPKYETKGWWYAPAEEVLGRTCNTCKTFCEITDRTGTKRRRTSLMHCTKCNHPGGRAGTHSTCRNNMAAASRTRTTLTPDASALDGRVLRRSKRAKGSKSVNYHVESESECQSDEDDDGRDKQLLYGIKMRAADPRYLTTDDDINRGDIILTMAQVKELITVKLRSEEKVATIWLTTAEMGFSLMDEPNTVVCTKDVREGKVCDRYLAPAISEFVTNTLTKTDVGTEADQQSSDVWRELVSLHRRWSKITYKTEGDNLRAQAYKDADASQRFTRIVQRKSLPWEKDSIARAAYDPAPIPDCNVQATVGQHFIFNEPIPRAENGQGYLRVTKKSLWWQTARFPTVWTSEGLTTCMETGYPFTINSTTWNHLRAMWQASPLDLLRLVHQETHVQNVLEASGYRTPTWRILRALQSICNANVVVGESLITAAPFFEGAGRPSQPFWGPQRGRKVILWEGLSPEDQVRCCVDLQKDKNWVVWCKAKPKDMATQKFRAYGKCIFDGKRINPKKDDNPEDFTGGKHVTRARSWWKRGDVSACAAQTKMQCWVPQDMIFDSEQAETNLQAAWEHEDDKDEMNITLHGLERNFWKGTEAGWLGCYEFPGESWAGDGSVHKGVMGAGCVCLQRPGRKLQVRVGREAEGTSSLRAELAAMARALQATPLETDLIYLCDSEAALNRMSRWIGSGPKTTLAGDPNADIVILIVERMRERVLKGARTFLVKVKAHRGEPLNEKADTQAESARQLPSEHRQWTTRTQAMTYEWRDKDDVKHVTAWSKAVRNAMLRGGAEYQRQKALNRAAHNWNKAFLLSTNSGLQRIRQATTTGAQSDLMDSTRWGWKCMHQLQETDTWKQPATTTWAAEFLLREGESREFLGSWLHSNDVHEAKKRRAKQVISCSFPCGKWLHMIGARKSPGCELCKRERKTELDATNVPAETVAHLQSAGCKAQKKSVIGAHNRCWKYLVGAIITHGEAKRDLEFIGGDKDRQLNQLWTETRIGSILPWEDIEDEAERLLESDKGTGQTATDTRVDQDLGNDQGVEREETDSYKEVIFGRRRPDSIAIDWNNKILHVLEFKRTSDQRHTYRERGESRARAQHDVLVRSLEKVAEEATGENKGWKIKLIIFVGGTCGSVHTQTFNNNLKELGVVESKRNSIRKGLVYELLNAQDTVLCSYFAQRSGERGTSWRGAGNVEEVFQGLDSFI